ncbi:UNVERIFIED_CONTAM: hypothetical protein PYX00_002002 [Menopon gallinae]|uniref:Aquaporin n=1 Tax=Menopon gallinae TaxID=328185 RepID=A0AAW2IGD3_9NEOP
MATIAPEAGMPSTGIVGRTRKFFTLNDQKAELIIRYIVNFFSEVVSTGILVFLVCLGGVNGLGQNGNFTGAILCASLGVFMAIQVGSQVSGGHANPAVTVLSLFFKKLTFPMAINYICGQVVGGILGFGLIILITPTTEMLNEGHKYGLGTTVPHPDLSLLQALIVEFLLTVLLMAMICSAWDPRNAYHDSMSLKIGLSVFPLAYAGAPYSGCSMNPARSFGPALWNNVWKDHWIYWVGPLSGAMVCGFFYTTFFCPKISRNN